MSSPRLEALLQISDTIVGPFLPQRCRRHSNVPIVPVTLEDSEREHILKILRKTKGLLGGPKAQPPDWV